MTVASDLQKVHVVGAGLIGTSIALAAKAKGLSVTIEDLDPQAQALARDLIKSHSEGAPNSDGLLVVVAVPPLSTPDAVVRALSIFPNATVMDVASVKTNVTVQVQALSENSERFVPTHPIAGRESGGPKSAQADLFRGRAWILSPGGRTRPDSIELVSDFITGIGATPYLMDAKRHDELLARISHLPQLVSSALASLLSSEDLPIQVAGQGLRDVTRLAESDPYLWQEILESNKSEVLEALKVFRDVINGLVKDAESEDFVSIKHLMERGRAGRRKISGKHGSQPRAYSIFHIVIDDRPGVLGDLFSLMAEHGINVEDLDIEHSPNQETGLITISVAPEQSGATSDALRIGNWLFHLEGVRE